MTVMKAPNGDAIQGTSELVPGVALGSLCVGDDEVHHDGGTNIDWDAQKSRTIAGAVLFMDESGNEWPQHHLIPAEAKPLTDETISAMVDEDKLGAALDSAKAFAASLRELQGIAWITKQKEADLNVLLFERLHHSAKSIALGLRQRDLQAQASTEHPAC